MALQQLHPGAWLPQTASYRLPGDTARRPQPARQERSQQHLHLWGQCHSNIYVFGVSVMATSASLGSVSWQRLHFWVSVIATSTSLGSVSWQHLHLWGQCHGNIYIFGVSVMATSTSLASVSWQHLHLWGQGHSNIYIFGVRVIATSTSLGSGS